MSERPLVSVIIVNYNGLRFLEKCLTAVAGQTYPAFEVLLVDNGSSDGSVGFVRERFPAVRVLEAGKNLGFAAGNNLGIREAKGELIATLNNDTEATPGWLAALARPMIADPSVGMCASKMLLMARPGLIDSTGIEVSRSGACWDRGMLQPADRYGSPGEVFGPCAGAALYRRKMLDEVGLFDEDFFTFMEDADLAFRGNLAGWKCAYAPEAVVYHYHGGTAGFMSGFSVYYGNRNIVWLAVKDFPGPLLLTSLPWIIGRNLITIPYYCARGHGGTVVRSKVDALKGVPAMWSKRRHWPAGSRVKVSVKTWAAIPRTDIDAIPGTDMVK